MASNSRFAFFDVDDTLIRIKSMFDFYRYWALEVHSNPDMLELFEAGFNRMLSEGQPREILNRTYYRFFAGVHPNELELAGATWAQTRLVDFGSLFVPSAVSELKMLKMKSIIPVFVSGSFDAVLKPLARYLGVSHILATKMLVGSGGTYTGEISDPQTIGAGKAVAIQEFLAVHDAQASRCMAFGDDLSDLPMLECVGEPVVVGFGTPLAAHAQSKNWATLAGFT